MKKENRKKRYFELQEDLYEGYKEHYNMLYQDKDLLFLEKGHDISDILKFLDNQEYNKKFKDFVVKKLSKEELEYILLEGLEYNDITTKKELLEADIEDFIYLLEFNIAFTEELISNFLSIIGYKIGTSGYSTWTYYIAQEDINKYYIDAIWDGYNFYNLIEWKIDTFNNEMIDIIEESHNLYLTSELDINIVLNDNFNLDLDTEQAVLLNYDDKAFYQNDIESRDFNTATYRADTRYFVIKDNENEEK